MVEGLKTVRELLGSNIVPQAVYATSLDLIPDAPIAVELVSEADLARMTHLKSANNVLAVFHVPKARPVDFSDWVVVLDDVRDPGNLGTIIRLCDWFGIPHLICSPQTVDCFNPKVVQATMGSLARVNVVYRPIGDLLQNPPVPVYGTFMTGTSVYQDALQGPGMLVMGNEANGISPEVERLVTHKVGIPSFGAQETESLNVATATAILLSEVRRRG